MPPITSVGSKDLGNAYQQRLAAVRFGERDNKKLGRRLERITDTYPHLNAATAIALAEAGYDEQSVETRVVGDLQVKRDTEKKSGWGRFTSAVSDVADAVAKPAVRVGLTALGAPYEAMQAGFREQVERVEDGDLMGAAKQAGRWAIPGKALTDDVLDAVEGDNSRFNQTRLGAGIQVANQTGVSLAQSLNNTPEIPDDGDTTALLERKQSTWLPGPNSLAEKQQVRNTRAAGTTSGRATTFGRAAGRLVGFQPGGVAHNLMANALASSPFLSEEEAEGATGTAQTLFEGGLDVGAALVADPVGRIAPVRARQLARADQFRGATTELVKPELTTTVARVTDKATRQVREVPITVQTGVRSTVVFEKAADYVLRSKAGDRLAAYGAAETSYSRLSKVLGRDVPPQTVIRLLDEQDPVRWKDALLEEMGRGFITRKTDPGSLDLAAVGQGPLAGKFAGIASATSKMKSGRWRQLAPSETFVSRSDPTWAVEQYRRTLHAMATGRAKESFTPEFIDKNVEEFARAVVDPDADWSVPVLAMAGAAKQSLIGHGVQRGHAEQLTRIWQERVASQRNYWIDPKTGQAKHAFATVDGDDMPLAKAAASSEMFTDGIPLINPQEFKRAAARMNRLYQSPGWEGLVAVGDGLTSFFKFMVLPVRGPAWMMRNLAEAQGRVTMEGLPGVFNSPLEALAWRVGDNPRSAASRLLGRTERERGRGATDAAGEDFRLRAELEDNADAFARTQEHKGGPWNDNLIAYTNEYPIVRRSEGSYDQWLAGNRFTLGKLAASPEYRMAVQADNPDHAKNLFWASKRRTQMAQREPELLTREGADRFMDKVMERVDDVTGGHPALREAIGTGRIDGVLLVDRNARGHLTYNEKALRTLDKYADHLPEFTVTPGTVAGRSTASAAAKGVEAMDRLVFARAFALFGSVPNNRFVNSPTFRQLHWQDAVRLAPLGTEDARKALIANARKANMPKSVIRELEEVRGPAGALDAEDIRDLADQQAFTRWMDIVYNSHNKGNWTQSVRMLSPFAAAVADMYRYWGKRLVKNPLVLHRVEQGMHGARQSGFVYVDENGEERFTYPLTEAFSRMATGVPAALSGTVRGANMITSSLLPGFGPVVTWPAGWFIPDQKKTDDIRKIINPYGDPDASGGLLEGFAPGHVQRALAAVGMGSPEQKRRYTETVADTMAYLASTGDYGNSEDEQARLRRDAEAKGQLLYLIQAVAQGGLPSSPRTERFFTTPNGKSIAMSYLAADFRRLMRENPDSARQDFLTKYGDAAFLAVTGSTSGTAQLTTQEAHDLAREHPEVVDKYGQVWSFFTDPASPYSHDEFRRQIAAGERDVRTLKQRQVAAQSSIAWAMYFQYKNQFGPFPTTQEGAYLKYVKAEIRKQYPLWDLSYDAQKTRTQVEQALAAAKDPALRDSDVAAAVRQYEQARRQVIDNANASGATASESGWGSAKATETHRDYLRAVAAQLIGTTPGFRTLWDRVFSNEMVDDVEGQP